MKNDLSDYYGVLEITERASKEVIEAAYKTLKKKFKDDQHVLEKIAEAYAVLSDSRQRSEYDLERNKDLSIFEEEYEIVSHLAESEHGDVYIARHLLTGMKVCVKHCRYVSPQHEQLLINEAKAIWNQSHHGIAFARDLKRLKDGTLALIMRYIPGITLKNVIDQIGMMEAEHVMRFTERLVNILWYLHSREIVHGGIEPNNIIINKNYEVFLIGYSLAMIKPKFGDNSTGFINDFSPPEQKRYEVLTDESDFYSLGKVMLYMLGGGIDAVKNNEIPSDTPDPICEFIKDMIDREIENRPSWRRMNVFDEVKRLRAECFGRLHTNGSNIPGLKFD